MWTKCETVSFLISSTLHHTCVFDFTPPCVFDFTPLCVFDFTHFFNLSSFLFQREEHARGCELSRGQREEATTAPKVPQPSPLHRPVVGNAKMSGQMNISCRNIANISAIKYYEYLANRIVEMPQQRPKIEKGPVDR